jgi:heme-degrading monooxygenase HmoA
MIRAIYRWHVQPGAEDTFIAAWNHGTRAIRARIRGAQGSVLIRNHSQPREFIAVARWDSLEDWQAFSIADLIELDAEAFKRMSAVSTLVSTEVGEEVADLVQETTEPSVSWTPDDDHAYAAMYNHGTFMRPYPGLLEVWHPRPYVGLVGGRDGHAGTRSPVDE